MADAAPYQLEGIRVLDFSRIVAGPFAGRLLTDLGADVVKIEPPEGDDTRLQGKKVLGISGFFNQQNAGKRNISLNLRAGCYGTGKSTGGCSGRCHRKLSAGCHVLPRD